MRKITSKLTAFFLSVVIVISLFPALRSSASVEATGKCGKEVNWELDSEGTLKIYGSGPMYNYPDAPPDYAEYNYDIKTVVFSGDITHIGKDAFLCCHELTSITIPESVTSIGFEAFKSCESLTSITIPDSVTELGIYTFEHCISLENVTLPNHLTKIDTGVFCECTSLESITIPDGVPFICDKTFKDCENLQSITIPVSVHGINPGAFEGCYVLTDVYYAGTRAQFEAIEGYEVLDDATVHCTDSIKITKQPEDYTGPLGSTATFSVVAEGSELQYKWQAYVGNKWINFNISGFDTDTISLVMDEAYDGIRIRCKITDSYGFTEYSDEAKVYIADPLSITSQPKDYTGAVGSTATFKVVATGTGLKYQWQYKSGNNWVNSSANGAKTAQINFTIKESHNGSSYRCVVTDSTGKSINSSEAKVYISQPLKIVTQPSDYTGAVGSNATFKIVAQGTGLKYQWQYKSGNNWVNSSANGAKTAQINFTIKESHNGSSYRCVVTDSTGKSINSSEAKVYISQQLKIVTQPSDYTGSVGSKATFKVVAQGTGLKYQWQYKKGSTWVNSSANGAKTAQMSFTINSSHNGVSYRCVVTDSTGKSINSSEAKVYISQQLKIVTQPSDYTGAVGSKATFKVVAQGSGLKYQWQYKSGSSWVNSSASGAKTAEINFTVKSSHNETSYRCVITDSTGKSIKTNEVKVHIK